MFFCDFNQLLTNICGSDASDGDASDDGDKPGRQCVLLLLLALVRQRM